MALGRPMKAREVMKLAGHDGGDSTDKGGFSYKTCILFVNYHQGIFIQNEHQVLYENLERN